MNDRARRTTHGLLAGIAVLLLLNLVVSVTGRQGIDPGSMVAPAQAATPLRLDANIIVTTNQEGSILYIWQLGRYVGDGYENVNVRSYTSGGQRY